MDAVFMHVGKGNTISTHLGLKGEKSTDWKIGRDYSYIELLTADIPEGIEAGDYLPIRPVATVNPRKCKLIVVPNAQLAKAGLINYQSILEPGDGDRLGFAMQVSDPDALQELDWVCRIYAVYG